MRYLHYTSFYGVFIFFIEFKSTFCFVFNNTYLNKAYIRGVLGNKCTGRPPPQPNYVPRGKTVTAAYIHKPLEKI
jgi:hypothetical protein